LKRTAIFLAAFLLIVPVAAPSAGVQAAQQIPSIAAEQSFEAYERAITADPENLRVAADYRQKAIAEGKVDRAISFLERLADRRGSGPNIKLSLALAYVDKVPTVGDIRKLYLGRDAIDVLTKSIAQKPTSLTYYIRGLINLYYNNFIYHRVPKGLADLEMALKLVTPDTKMVWRAYVSMGDGYWRLEQPAKAREFWKKGLDLFPDTPELMRRLESDDVGATRIVDRALDPDTRVDTSLRGVLP
jgi:tetratricopeptide (TPR) repeat protein